MWRKHSVGVPKTLLFFWNLTKFLWVKLLCTVIVLLKEIRSLLLLQSKDSSKTVATCLKEKKGCCFRFLCLNKQIFAGCQVHLLVGIVLCVLCSWSDKLLWDVLAFLLPCSFLINLYITTISYVSNAFFCKQRSFCL